MYDLARGEAMVAARKAGMTLQAIGDEHGISKSRVATILHVHPRRARKKALMDEGLSARTIGNMQHLWGTSDPAGIQRQNPDRIEMLEHPNVGRKTVVQVDAYLKHHGQAGVARMPCPKPKREKITVNWAHA